MEKQDTYISILVTGYNGNNWMERWKETHVAGFNRHINHSGLQHVRFKSPVSLEGRIRKGKQIYRIRDLAVQDRSCW